DLFAQALGLEPLAQRDRVTRLPLTRQLPDGAKNQLMVATVEVLLGETIGHFVPRFGGQHETTEHSLLRVDGVRWHTQCIDTRVTFGRAGKYDSHHASACNLQQGVMIRAWPRKRRGHPCGKPGENPANPVWK